MNTRIFLDHEPGPDGRGWIVRALLRLEGEAPESDERAPLNLSIVLDRSGSMHGAKLAAARQAAALLARRLAPEDVVSVVAYDESVRTVAEPATGAEQTDLARRIEAIESGGTTNLSGGWLRGRELVASELREGGVNRVLLLTDGLANVGITDPGRLRDLVATAATKGVSTTTIGFGEGYDEELLRSMADAGGGNTYYIEHADQAPAVFESEIEGLLGLAAQNVTVEVRAEASVRLAAVHHRYPREAVDGGLRLELGDLYAREPKGVLAEFLVGGAGTEGRPDADADTDADADGRGRSGDDATDVATVLVTAHVVTADGGVERREIELPITLSPEEGGSVEPEVRREMLLLEAAKAREGALERRGRGDFDGAREVLDSTARTLNDLLVAEDGADDELAEEIDDLRAMAKRFEEQSVTEADAKYLYQRTYARRTGRVRSADVISRTKRQGADVGKRAERSERDLDDDS
ncbi:MAG: vWA domain-containing protein [Gemmatimonadota bacterium]